MNLVFISPNFPTYYWNFCKSLRERGVTVLGVGDAPYDDLVNETKESLVEYYRVNNLQNYDEVYRAMGFFIGKYGRIDYIESQNEFWLELEAQLREDFNIHHGLRPKELEVMKFKSKMKDVYKKANVPTAKYKVLIRRLKRIVSKALKYIIEGLVYSDFNIEGTEIEFGKNGKYKPIQLQILESGKRVEITGKIDRIDTATSDDGKYLRIIDYKSSAKNIDLNEVYAGLQLQLLTYMDAVCKEEDLMPAGVLYFSLLEQIASADKKITEEEIEEKIRKIHEDLKMNRERFSEMIDISDVFLGQIERGEHSLSTKTLVKIVKFTGVSADFILFGNEESNTTLSEINRILNKCSEDLLNYIYVLGNYNHKMEKS